MGAIALVRVLVLQVVVDCVSKWLKVPSNFEAIDYIVFCVFDRQDYTFYDQVRTILPR